MVRVTDPPVLESGRCPEEATMQVRYILQLYDYSRCDAGAGPLSDDFRPARVAVRYISRAEYLQQLALGARADESHAGYCYARVVTGDDA